MNRKSTLFSTIIFSILLYCIPNTTNAQDSKLGGWYMYFGNFRPQNSQLSIHGEAQYRNHDVIGDLQQLLLRTGLRYHLKDNSASFLVGYGYILSQSEGDINNSFYENRIYQEAVLRQSVGAVRVNHRYRFEQRFIEDRDFRTRFRYGLFVNVPLQKSGFEKGSWYFAFYNEIFINGDTKATGKIFDRNRLYGALGYKLGKNLGIQAGYMSQIFAQNNKGQLQVSLHHNIRP